MPSPSSNLTGNTRYRSAFRGKLILQVEEKLIHHYSGSLRPGAVRKPVYETSWRDARVTDMWKLEALSRK